MREIVEGMPEVEGAATRIWFSFYPLLMAELPAPDEKAFRDFFQVKGPWRLAEAVDTSHAFHPRHGEWAAVKQAIAQAAPRGSLLETIRGVGGHAGMAGIGLMTLRQVGAEKFFATDGRAAVAKKEAGWLGKWLGKRGGAKVRFEGPAGEGEFAIIPSQEITTAAERDKGAYEDRDPRCLNGMGPIPVDCKSGSCGTCWVGVLEGNDQLGPVSEYERKRMEYFGYWDAGFEDKREERPRIRLACQAQAFGPVRIVIPQWCAVWGGTRRERWRP